jgi:hypothetical protein
LSPNLSKKLEHFINHKIWQPKEDRKATVGPSTHQAQQHFQSSNTISGPSLHLWQKLEGRFNEMGDRKRRLFIKKQQAE